MTFIPVIDKKGNPLMPTKPSRARKWIKSKKATPFWKNGVFCLRLNVDPSATYKQDIVIGIDPGSKKEGFTIKSKAHTYKNIQADAVTYVSSKVETRRNLRKNRRHRKRRNRAPRWDRLRNKAKIAPSTRARWDWKIRIIDFFNQLFPINKCIIEDIRAIASKNKKAWNINFSPIEIGKRYAYDKLYNMFGIGNLFLIKGYETKKLRDQHNLEKLKDKMSSDFHAHCVDSWVMAHSIVGGEPIPENKKVFYISPINYQRRCLHRQTYSKGGKRNRYGGTVCLGIKKGTLVKHISGALYRISGYQGKKYNITKLDTKERIKGCPRTDFKVLKKLSFNFV